ncbi:hypothetical protein [Marinomonas aquimarina]|uniref:hypothetical protein n=1 Tax=Marinomonas aquimarina TaxID=295068 RepID=UPI00082B4EFC|nr:hypothetical protein [Marinomonas aquimarina]
MIAAFCLHAGVFLWFKDRHWSTITPPAQAPNFEVSLLPEKLSTTPSKPEPQTAQTPAPATIAEPSTQPAAIAPSKAQPATTEEAVPTATATTSSPPVTQAFSLSEITEVISTTEDSNQWKNNGLLDIGQVTTERPKLDPSKDPFSPKFRQAIRQAKRVQDEYAKGIIEATEYPITEDADGTRYVNIKGICWKLPKPGSREEWQVVLSGCSGQKQTFRFELNITTDILQSDLFEDLHFGSHE